MKSIKLLSIFFSMAGLAFGQVYFSNNVPSKVAIKVVSRLHVGMWEEDAKKILRANGINYAMSVGANAGWSSAYGLSDGCSLALEYRARTWATNGLWGGNGLLQTASIESNGVNIISIPLTNAPSDRVGVKSISN